MKDIQRAVQEEAFTATTSAATLPNKITSYSEAATGYMYLDPASSQLFTQTQRIPLQVSGFHSCALQCTTAYQLLLTCPSECV